uniref:Uncharacterized protein n=1 Tax=Ascaris lumbricoides TaxID=6252 RepID=A0A0M3IIN7_ASCLU
MDEILTTLESTIYIILMGIFQLIPIQICLIICKSSVEPGFEGRPIPKVGKSCESIEINPTQNIDNMENGMWKIGEQQPPTSQAS